MAETPDNRIEVLRLVLADVEKERDRLRDARGSFAARLGPLPASAAVVTGIIAAAANEVDWPYAAAAGLVFGVLVTISVRFSGLTPYREFRGKHQRMLDATGEQGVIAFRRDDATPETWLEQKLELEQKIYGDPGEGRHRLMPTHEPKTLTQALNSERAAGNIVQALVVLIFAILIVGFAAAG